jgi:hypothetical protein
VTLLVTSIEKIAFWRTRSGKHLAAAAKTDNARLRAAHESFARSYLVLIDTEECMMKGTSRDIPCR